jgi:GAF domain-containing protein
MRDHRADIESERRWPQFAPNAAEHGFVSVSAVPMRLRTHSIGALNMFSNARHALSDDDVRVAQGLADIATIGILQHRAIEDANELSAHLEAALDSRIVIEQAKGILAQHDQISVDNAFTRIRSFARAHQLLLSATARQIVDGTLPFNELAQTQQSRPRKPNTR